MKMSIGKSCLAAAKAGVVNALVVSFVLFPGCGSTGEFAKTGHAMA